MGVRFHLIKELPSSSVLTYKSQTRLVAGHDFAENINVVSV